MKKLFLIIILAIASAPGVRAQEAQVESLEMTPMDVTAQKYSRLDLHGEKCDIASNKPTLTTTAADTYAADIALTKEYETFKDSSTGKYGYKHNGRVVIPAKYDYAWPFSEGLARVEINGKYGFIDKTDSMVIPAKYDYAWPFSSGKAKVKLNGREFYIDRNGNEVQ